MHYLNNYCTYLH